MFLTQIYGTVLGGFVNYGVMISIVSSNRDALANGNGSNSWSGATLQSYNTNATTWALAKYLYKTGAVYSMVPIGLAIGAGIVAVHRAFVYVGAFHASNYPCLAASLSPLTQGALSLFPGFENSRLQRSTSPSSSNMLATSHTTSPRPASS